MRYADISVRPDAEFKRYTGVRRDTFFRMVAVYQAALSAGYKQGKNYGRPRALCAEDEVYLLLMYYREYRPFLHIGRTFGVSEPTAWRIVRRVEAALISHPDFHLPGKKALYESARETFVVDVSEVDIERPQKNKNGTTAARKSATP